MGDRRGLDIDRAQPVAPKHVSAARQARGQRAHLSGSLAEDSVVRSLERRGIAVLARRWRGKSGEIDLVCQDGGCLIFVEVKQSATHQEAALRLGPAQQGRIMRAALEYCENEGREPLPEMRFDAALVDGQGRVEMVECAFDDSFA